MNEHQPLENHYLTKRQLAQQRLGRLVSIRACTNCIQTTDGGALLCINHTPSSKEVPYTWQPIPLHGHESSPPQTG